MNRKAVKAIVWASVGALAMLGALLVVTSAWAGPNQTQVGVNISLAPAGIVSSTLSYQGQLLNGGSPVNGMRVMTFSVYAQASGGAPLWSQIINVSINRGLFTVYLQVDPVLFNGQALWLGVTVAGETEMTPRQQLLPAPYAFSLRPGAVISGTWSDPILRVINSGNGHAIWASANVTYPTFYGENMGVGPALLGHSVNGTGVSGQGLEGVRGQGTSTGIFGEGMTGVRGQSLDGIGVSGSSANNSAILGESINGTGVWANSVHGHALKTNRPALIAGPNSKQIALLRWYPAIATTTTLGVGLGPAGVAFDGANIWVTNHSQTTVSVLRANDGSHVMTPTVGTFPIALAYDGINMWVVNGGLSSGYIRVLRASDGALVKQVDVGVGPWGIAFDGINMWVTNSISNSVSVLAASDGTHVVTPTVGAVPAGIAFDGTNMWIVNSNSGTVSVLHPGPQFTYVMTPTVGYWPHFIAFDGANMWVSNTGDDTVSVLRASDGATLATIPVGNKPSYIAFDGTNMWVVNEDDDTVTIVRATDFATIGVVPVGDNPRGIAFDGANMWIANTDANTVSKR